MHRKCHFEAGPQFMSDSSLLHSPQRGPMSDIEFRNYFLAYDVVIGIFVNSTETNAEYPRQGTPFDLKSLGPLESAEPSERIGCFYYIKPNYPGRSSHLCNAGFVVPPNSRGRGIGSLAGRSFLHVAPRLGYRGSVFNLVYATNEASMRIWDKLGFQRVGRIPSAGLLKTGSGEDEHYVDAHVIYGDFAKIAPPFV
ncbi:hypothetical protein K437DRAFT_256412 [Tilletiaria anomala UBC 951]|uniref:N-acetyltransferase domain-containing protein n=1 Tax=Tilletiaria anomala (strain ATCC 24038 / CBS 436.72 / UBC 951) TaxID=1037660 RepID=A0A066VWR0_TILAU|nr:uncharacterized protein K437DRAFT_256412 [Tilletiaria anomala UBC 951]KDN45891.1 hypothetical protein K437DRAFT_256412 [Tilletiaria anomala UBC 951]